jgi:hypothetical protein
VLVAIEASPPPSYFESQEKPLAAPTGDEKAGSMPLSASVVEIKVVSEGGFYKRGSVDDDIPPPPPDEEDPGASSFFLAG